MPLCSPTDLLSDLNFYCLLDREMFRQRSANVIIVSLQPKKNPLLHPPLERLERFTTNLEAFVESERLSDLLLKVS